MSSDTGSAISWKHLIALIGGAVLIAFAPIFAVLSKTVGGVGMLDAAFWRVLIGGVTAGCFAIPMGQALGRGDVRIGPWIWAPGFFFAGDFAVWHISFDHTSVANSTLLANFQIVVVTVFAWWMWKEKISRLFVIGATVAMLGLVLLLHSSATSDAKIREGAIPLLGDALGLATAFFYGSYLLTIKRYRRDLPVPTLMFWGGIVAAAFLAPVLIVCHAVWGHSNGNFFPTSLVGWLPLIGMGVISHAGGQGLIAFSLKGLPASVASITLLIQPVCTAFLGAVLLGQSLAAVQILAASLVLGGLAIAIRGQVRG
ncbi:MAG: drug/metabolite transporter (DMT)-like permease [Verrucomicrobiales bacterium]|jgi:drug/metabolite transporter (DMT)-like permease